ncbi:guanine nucleotide-binding protein subunit alpha-12-like [Paramacrobiotus metropolitanus]|uniref:guanine nucleotide-binding protein subunit alpha-12-like n=1 Tax=Paramacrobiotus metropolitanus TaxID=2943436 RepID=UPI002445776D|nr:guanine nucleotide-binding protein subunit alpha-12-like [Paramacrobiotus metropolitanus]XP_055343271.1 guanine nucleotide-binding protein subunit alpha-12-like [Paramacrobiotus metropolitanus]
MPCDFLLSCLNLEDTKQRQSRIIDKELHKQKRQLRRQMKILLLGAGESGKSTFLKQIRIMHGDSFSDYAIQEFILTIRQNVIMGMKVLLDARRKLGIPWKDPLNEAPSKRVFNCDVQLAVEPNNFCQNFVPAICALWADSAVKLAFERRREYQLGDSIKYFLVELPRIGLRDYKPTNLDILHARKATKGITEYTVAIQNVPFLFVDVGGQRSQRQKWFQCFESVNAILFLAAANEYDQVLLEDRQTSRIMEACAIFETIVNNLVFVEVAIILFLNKTDLLEEKYQRCLISDFLPEFLGNPRDIKQVKDFLLGIFDRCRKDRSKSLYHHWTSVIDTQHTHQIFSYVRDEIRRENLRQIGLY